MSTMDFSGLARGARDMEDLRAKTLATATEMKNLGRMTQDEFDRVSTTITAVSADMDSYNVRFREANDSSTKHKRDWSIIQRMVGNAAKKFAGFSGLNILTDMFREGAAFFQDLDRNAVKIGKMTLLIGSAAASIIHLVGGLAVMGQDLAAIGNLGILAPGFLTAMGIGIGVAVAALKDMGTVLEDLGPKFGKLQDVISEKFWAQAEGPIRNLVSNLLPTLTTQLGNTATGMGGLMAAFTEAFQGAASPERVTGMFEKMNAAIDILKGAMAPLVQAFVTMGEIGSQYFERFATWLVELSTRFNNFIQAAAADGRLNAWIETAITNLQAVGSILGSLVGIWNAIGDAASGAGIGGLAEFATALENASAAMNSPAFQSTLMLLFVGAANAARDVGQAIIDLGPSIESIMPTIALALVSIGDTMATVIGYIGQIMQNPAVQQGISDFIGGISTGVAALAPAIGPMADSLGQVGSLLGQIAAQLGPLVAAFVTGLAPVLDQVTAAFARITFAAGPVILDLINQIVPVFQNLMDTLLPPLENLIMTLLPLLGPAFAAITPIIDALTPIFGTIVSAIGQLVAMIAPFLVPALQQISAAVTPVIEVLGQVVNFILSILVPILGFLLIGVINNVVGVFQGLSNFIMGFVAIVTAIFTGFGTFFTKLFSGDIGGALTALGDMFKGIWDGIVQMLSGALEAIWNFVQLLFIGKMIKGITTGLTTIGNFFKSAWDDIVRGVQTAFTTMQSGVSNGINAIANFFRAGWNGMVNILRQAWDDIVNGVTTGVNNVMSWVQGIPGKISGALSGLGNLLSNAGKAIIDGLLSGLKAAWGGVTSFVGGIADWIANNKGPLPYDRALLVPAGKAIMDGLGNGLESKLAMLKGVLDTVTSTMEDSITDAFAKSRMYVAGADAALGLADGLKSRKSDVANALNAVMPSGPTASGSVNLTANGSGNQGVGTPTPAGNTIIVEAGAIPITTPTKDPELVASKVIDGFAGFSNF
jgi:phage-related protein